MKILINFIIIFVASFVAVSLGLLLWAVLTPVVAIPVLIVFVLGVMKLLDYVTNMKALQNKPKPESGGSAFNMRPRLDDQKEP